MSSDPILESRLQRYTISANNWPEWTKKFKSYAKMAPRWYTVRGFFVYSQ